ncbi:unnamed protein product [Anisakis simplex]|uniref:Sentrin-specific protease (inferred by orthology to a C. elegans protein) n=1 Tax=Anisakis simplex TaxID=6269 RepID=A0A0M3K346_ANISI|nr:unnamed protein product [Anisakis simplex]
MDSGSPSLAVKRRRLNSPLEDHKEVFINEERSSNGWFGPFSSLVSKLSNAIFHREPLMSTNASSRHLSSSSSSSHSSSSHHPTEENCRRKAANTVESSRNDDSMLNPCRLPSSSNQNTHYRKHNSSIVARKVHPDILTDDDDEADGDEVVDVTPNSADNAIFKTPPSFIRRSPSWRRSQKNEDDDVQIIDRNGSAVLSESHLHQDSSFGAPVEANINFEKENTPLEVSATSSISYENETLIVSSSPSPLPEHSASRTVSPLYLRPGSTNRIDKWSRRNRSQPWSTRPRAKTKQSSHSLYANWESPVNRIRKQLGIGAFSGSNGGASENVINMEEKERFRRLNNLLEAGGANFVPFIQSPYVRSSIRSNLVGDSVDVLQRGRAALNALLNSTTTNSEHNAIAKAKNRLSSSKHSSSSPISERSEDESEEVQIIENGGVSHKKSLERISSSEIIKDGGSQPVLNRNLSSPDSLLPRKSSSGSSRSTDFSDRRTPSVTVIWDKQRDESFKAKLADNESKKELFKQRELSYEQNVQHRNRRAQEILLEKQLLIESRRDAETTLEEELVKKLTLTGHVFRSRVRKIVTDEFPKLSDEAEQLIRRVWDPSLPLEEKMVCEISRRDLLTLRGLEWLNDEIINFYMNLICVRSQNDSSLPKVFAFTSFFYPSLLNKGYQAVRRWTRKVDVFSFDILLIPVHLVAHWCLAVVDFVNKRIDYFDSMGGENRQCLAAVAKYLGEEMNDKKKSRFDLNGWKLVTRDDVPQQMNGSDCGMFACKFAEFASRRAQISFSQEHMPYFRRRMVYEICRQKLL